ncbi:putative efflux protein, MATE family [Clostridium amylolyticum]|uniref:Probable multidrug resistance protein NorM n=1 Tax=Clostridium amylolyticum TaxID=1121298 RepID=A0A1M6LXB1_9CLOT|nr:MATE family efflux transporter [Clostridium amylolyticum]SHJ75838.1 putative efflux protein, MATE family [Clostridium amylolyticum]
MKDMTKGNPTKIILFFAFPMLLGNIFQQLYNMVDSIVVGKFVGKEALAAVGSSFMLMNFFSAIIIGLCMGTSVVLSQYFGAGDYTKLRKSISTAFIFMLLLTIIMSLTTIIFTKPMLIIMKTPKEILNSSTNYLQIIFGGLIFTFLFNFSSAVLRSVGDSKTPLYFLILASIINIILDLLFVINFNMGVIDVAIATVIAQGVSSLLCLVYAFIKLPVIRIKAKEFVFDRALFSMIKKYSLLTALQQSIMTFGMVCVQGLVNSFGTDTMAAFTAAGKVDSLAYLPVQDFGNAFATYVAQNKGAGNFERIKIGVKSAVRTIIVFCIISSTVILLSSKHLMQIFVSSNEVKVIHIGIQYLSVISVFYVLIGFLFMFYGYFRGMGNLKTSIVLTIVSLGTRVSMAYFLSSFPKIAEKGIWWSIPLGWALADMLGLYIYKRNSHP